MINGAANAMMQCAGWMPCAAAMNASTAAMNTSAAAMNASAARASFGVSLSAAVKDWTPVQEKPMTDAKTMTQAGQMLARTGVMTDGRERSSVRNTMMEPTTETTSDAAALGEDTAAACEATPMEEPSCGVDADGAVAQTASGLACVTSSIDAKPIAPLMSGAPVLSMGGSRPDGVKPKAGSDVKAAQALQGQGVLRRAVGMAPAEMEAAGGDVSVASAMVVPAVADGGGLASVRGGTLRDQLASGDSLAVSKGSESGVVGSAASVQRTAAGERDVQATAAAADVAVEPAQGSSPGAAVSRSVTAPVVPAVGAGDAFSGSTAVVGGAVNGAEMMAQRGYGAHGSRSTTLSNVTGEMAPDEVRVTSYEVATPRSLEVGLNGGPAGSMRVHAVMESDGAIHASVRMSAGATAEEMGSSVGPLQGFLADHDVRVASVQVEVDRGGGVASGFFGSGGDSSNADARDEDASRQTMSADAGRRSVDGSAAWARPSAWSAGEVLPRLSVGAGISGGWLSVVA